MKGLLSRSRLPVLDEANVAPSALGPAFVPTLPPTLKSYVHLEHVGDQWEIRVAAGHEFDAGTGCNRRSRSLNRCGSKGAS